MSIRRRFIQLLDNRLFRRSITLPLVLSATAIGVVLSPVLLAVTFGADVLARDPRRQQTRLTILILGALIIETLGIVTAALYWIPTGLPGLGSQRWRWQRNRWYLGRYTTAMFSLITTVLGTTVEWRDHADVSEGPVVLLARHTSFFDALIPATVLAGRNTLLVHHVVTHGLRYSPCIDIVGNRFPNRFIKRTPGEGSAELARIRAIGALLDQQSAAIIFPEGTFRNPGPLRTINSQVTPPIT